MEELLRRELSCSWVKATGHSGGGCISQGQSYDTDQGRVFVKVNGKAEVRVAGGGVRGPDGALEDRLWGPGWGPEARGPRLRSGAGGRYSPWPQRGGAW